jgi:hypothetical protein
VATDCTADFSCEKTIEKTILRVLCSSEFSHNLGQNRKYRGFHVESALFEAYWRAATKLHMQAEERSIKDVKFMGTPRGVLAVEKIPGALKRAVARCDWPGGRTLREMIETEGYSKSPEVLAVIPKQVNPGGAFIERIAEKECRDLLCGPERKVSLFSGRILEDFGGFVMILAKPVAVRSPLEQPFYVWDEELDWERDDGGFAGAAADLLAGGGYHVE